MSQCDPGTIVRQPLGYRYSSLPYMFINLHIGRAYITLQYKYYTQHTITIMIQTEKYTDLC